MDNEKDKLALIKYEPQPLTVVERLELSLEQKRRELQESLEQGRVGDPFSTTFLISLAVSAAVTGAQMLITTLLTPKQHLKEERGRRTGELVINSELGILIPEVYFGMLSDGYGGSWVPAIVGWTSGIRKHVSTTTTQTGGGKFGGGGGGTTEVKEITYDLDWLLIWANKGPYRVLRSKANSDVIFDLYGEVSSYQGESASSYGAPYVISDYDHASGGKEVTLQANGAAFVQWTTVQSNGAATRQMLVYYRTSSNTVPIRVNVNGGANQDYTLPATNEVYLAYTVPVVLNNGANTIKVTNLSATFNIGIDKIYVFPGHGTAAAGVGGTGVFNPAPGADPTYDPELPPTPTSPYDTPFTRWSGFPTVDAYGAQTGSMNIMGSATDFAIYPGNTTQLPDPTYEAAIDAQFGAGSTPAYRGRCYEVDANFYLTRWGGVVPNRIALLEHDTIKKLSQMCDYMCSRVGMLTTDYDFSDFETITPRGLRILGTKFEAREPMASAENVYDVIYAEQEGVLVGKRKSALTSVASLTDEDFAWSDEEETPDGPLSVIDVIEPNELDLPRRVDVKYVDLDRDGEPGLQGYARQVTEGDESQTLDLQWTLTREEAQALAQKEVYRQHIEKPCRYVLSWEHLWINVGDIFTATLSDGFTYTILHAKDSGGIGARECEGIILDEPIFDQTGVVDPYGYEQPVVPIPAMTIVMLLDVPLLRDGDETNNNGMGYYMVGTPRNSLTDQAWGGFGLYVQRNGEWYLVSDSTLPGTIGKVVSTASLSTNTTVIDRTGTITVDIYGDRTLSSVTEDQMLAGANAAIIGDMVFQFATATPVGGFDNRWTLSVLLTGRKGTESHVTDTFTNTRFVLIDGAVKFVPALLDDLNVERNFAAVTAGQSLDDAAVIPFTWTGASKQPYPTTDHIGTRDSAGSLLIELNGRTRVGGGIRSYQAGATNEEREEYRVQILTSGGATTLPNGKERIIPVIVGMTQAALLNSDSSLGKYGYIVGNTLKPTTSGITINAISGQTVEQTGNDIQATLELIASNGESCGFGIVPATFNWRNTGLANIIAAAHIYISYANAAPSYVTVYEYGVNKYSLNSPGTSRYRIAFAGAETRVYRNWTGAAGELVYSSPKDQTFPYRVIAHCDTDECAVKTVTVTTVPFAKTIYAAQQQVDDFGSTQDPIKMDIWQHSKLTGPGPKTRVSL